MKVSKRDGQAERQTVAAAITDSRVLAAVARRWQPSGLFRSAWADQVVRWCVEYHLAHGQAPGKHVESLFAAWAQTADGATAELVERFLQSLDYADSHNPDFLIEQAHKLFDDVKLEKLLAEADGLRRSGDLEAAWSAVSTAHRDVASELAGVDVFLDLAGMKSAFDESSRPPLIEYQGALHQFFDVRDCLHRDCLVMFAGPAKRGKSQVLLDVGFRAMTQRKRVAYFAVGDMSLDQMRRRLGARAARMPLDPGPVRMPTSITRETGGIPQVSYQEKVFERGLSLDAAAKAVGRVQRRLVRSEESYLKLSCHPSRSLTVRRMADLMEEWRRSGFITDVCVLDYADLLAASTRRELDRDAINDNWTALRALSQKFHCLVVTATQTNRNSYYTDLINRDHFADDRRKIDHCHACIGINQTAEEKAMGVYRLNYFALREADYDERRCVYVASCLAVCDPFVRSCW